MARRLGITSETTKEPEPPRTADEEREAIEEATEDPDSEMRQSTIDEAVDGPSDVEWTPSEDAPSDQEPRGERSTMVQGAAVYRVLGRGRRYWTASWLYRWLTAEPEPEVIVIDLRDTYAVGPIIRGIDRILRELTPASVSSGIVRWSYRLRNRLLERPVRLVSFGLIAVVLGSFLALATSEDPIGLTTFVLFALLIVAVRGTQSTRSWGDLAETRWYGWLQSAFEPPEPPAPQQSRLRDEEDGEAES